VQQKKYGGIFRAGLPVKDSETINLYRAIKSRVFHGRFLSMVASRLFNFFCIRLRPLLGAMTASDQK
jgi:hypothetical protein